MKKSSRDRSHLNSQRAKSLFGFNAVPFVLAFGADGVLKYSGEPKGLDLATVFSATPTNELAAELAEKATVGATPAKPLGDVTA